MLDCLFKTKATQTQLVQIQTHDLSPPKSVLFFVSSFSERYHHPSTYVGWKHGVWQGVEVGGFILYTSSLSLNPLSPSKIHH